MNTMCLLPWPPKIVLGEITNLFQHRENLQLVALI
jgi:hypothetical protein